MVGVMSPLQPGQLKTPRGSRAISKAPMMIKTMTIAIILANIARYYPFDARIHHFTTDMGRGVLLCKYPNIRV